jgi:hypothetical protein
MSRAGKARGTAGRTLSLRPSIVVRGARYGALAGAGSGALYGAVVSLPYGSVAFLGIFAGGLVGGVTGLVTGTAGGVALALAAPCLVRHTVRCRIAGAAVIPGVLTLAWCSYAIWNVSGAVTILARPGGDGPLVALSLWGGAIGALVGPRVVHGGAHTAPGAGDAADSAG